MRNLGLILAGDTYHLDKDYSKLDFINLVSEQFKMVYLIPGNHEYYGGFDVSTALTPFSLEIKKNVLMLNNQSIKINGVNFIFSIMWSTIKDHPSYVCQMINDFYKIKFNKTNLTVREFNKIHEASFDFITEAVKGKGKKVVVTHHLPSNECNIQEFKQSMINEAFCVEKTDYILENNIDYWIYGHSHRNLKDFKIGNTQMMTNQLGYTQLNENLTFDSEKVVSLYE